MAAKTAFQSSPALLLKSNHNSTFICASRKSLSFLAKVPFSLSNYKTSLSASKPVVCATNIDEKRIDGAFSFSSTNRSEDESGVVNRIAGVFATRGYNTESLAVSLNEAPTVGVLVEAGDRAFLSQTDAVKRGPVYCAGSAPLLEAADSSIDRVTDPHTDVIIILQHSSHHNVMQDAIPILCENDNIWCQVMNSYTEKQLITKLSRSGRKVIIATDHGVGGFLDKIVSLASGSPVIGVPVRDSGVTGYPPQFVEMCPKHAILLVPVNDAKGAARAAMIICDTVHPGGRTLKRM